jgi:hypothetical protein
MESFQACESSHNPHEELVLLMVPKWVRRAIAVLSDRSRVFFRRGAAILAPVKDRILGRPELSSQFLSRPEVLKGTLHELVKARVIVFWVTRRGLETDDLAK